MFFLPNSDNNTVNLYVGLWLTVICVMENNSAA